MSGFVRRVSCHGIGICIGVSGESCNAVSLGGVTDVALLEMVQRLERIGTLIASRIFRGGRNGINTYKGISSLQVLYLF